MAASTENSSSMLDSEEMDPPELIEEPETPQMPSKSLKGIKNKYLREKTAIEMKEAKRKQKIQKKKQRKKDAERLGDAAPAKKIPHTIESLREPDVTMVAGEEDEELEQEEATDAYAKYFTKSYEPKVMITTTDTPHKKSYVLVRELSRIIPGAKPFSRKRSSIKKMVSRANSEGFTDVIVVNEDQRVPNGLLMIHLPDGPSAFFRMSNPKICRDLHRSSREITAHRPEVILNNFKTRLGRVVARMLGALFHYDPEFKGRRVCTFHNQRDYIFFRHHRYEFKNTEKVKLHELGPRFTLKLQWLQEGAFDGDYEWVLKRHDMETSRRRFFL